MRQIIRGTLILSLVLLTLSMSACQNTPSTGNTPTAAEPVEVAADTPPADSGPDNAPPENLPPLPEPSPTPLAPDFPLPIPAGQPGTEWKNIPIMPDAIQGAATDAGTYAFTIAASLVDIQAHYETLMPGKGWEHVITSTAQDGTIIMVFKSDAQNIKIAVFQLTAALAYVLLTP